MQRNHVVVATDVGVTDENLRHAGAPGQGDHFFPLGRIGIDVTGTIDGRRMLQVMNTYVLAFFDKHLKGEAQPLLDRSSERFPEVDFQVRASQSVRQQ